MKAELELVKLVLHRNVPDVRQVAQILEDLHQELASLVDEDKAPAVKKQYVVLLSQGGHVAWVVQIDESEIPDSAEGKTIAAAREFNATPKGRRLALKTIAEVMEHVPARMMKEHGVWVRTKEPVAVVQVGGKINPGK
jgi:hypothetical protein